MEIVFSAPVKFGQSSQRCHYSNILQCARSLNRWGLGGMKGENPHGYPAGIESRDLVFVVCPRSGNEATHLTTARSVSAFFVLSRGC
jgi:hypothetical protein